MKPFQIFKAECKRWISYFGLTAWEIKYIYGSKDKKHDGYCEWDHAAMRANICMDRKLSATPEEVARHEVCELLLAEMWSVACNTKSTPDSIYASRHKVINILMRMMKEMDKLTSNSQ